MAKKQKSNQQFLNAHMTKSKFGHFAPLFNIHIITEQVKEILKVSAEEAKQQDMEQASVISKSLWRDVAVEFADMYKAEYGIDLQALALEELRKAEEVEA
jgi:hypothetical protein